MTKILLIASFTFLIPFSVNAGSSCQTWNFQRTPVSTNDEIATWSFKEDRSGNFVGSGHSTFQRNGSFVDYDLVATISKTNQVVVERRNSTDNNDCYYHGKIDGNKIAGTFICTSYTSTPGTWSAIVTKAKC